MEVVSSLYWLFATQSILIWYTIPFAISFYYLLSY
jgi:hypothetical protein